jgi:hypothetical protein
MGRLGSYEISSNTDADSFVTSVTSPRPDALPPESAAGTCLAGLEDSKVAKSLLGYGAAPAPLSLIGEWLGMVASSVAKELDAAPNSRLLDSCVARRAVRVSGPTPLWEVTVSFLKPGHSDPPPTSAFPDLVLYAENLVCGMGGAQECPPDFFSPTPPSFQNKLLLSDDALSKEGLEKIRKLLPADPRGEKVGDPTGMVVVVGGSHSAFSVVWTLLNKLKDSSAPPPPPSSSSSSSSSPPPSSSTFPHVPAPYPFPANSITLLHRSPISVFYNTPRAAQLDNAPRPHHANAAGQINVFGGLRGDAKALYQRVRDGGAPAVKTYRTSGGKGGKAVARACAKDARVVVWCAGYKTRLLPEGFWLECAKGKSGAVGYDRPDGVRAFRKGVNFLFDGNQVSVSDSGQVLGSDSLPVPNLFGIGLGWGLKARNADGSTEGTAGRMDGVGVCVLPASAKKKEQRRERG